MFDLKLVLERNGVLEYNDDPGEVLDADLAVEGQTLKNYSNRYFCTSCLTMLMAVSVSDHIQISRLISSEFKRIN